MENHGRSPHHRSPPISSIYCRLWTAQNWRRPAFQVRFDCHIVLTRIPPPFCLSYKHALKDVDSVNPNRKYIAIRTVKERRYVVLNPPVVVHENDGQTYFSTNVAHVHTSTTKPRTCSDAAPTDLVVRALFVMYALHNHGRRPPRPPTPSRRLRSSINEGGGGNVGSSPKNAT